MTTTFLLLISCSYRVIKNIQSINNDSHVSEQQQKTMSRILSDSTPSTKPAVLECTSQNKRVLAQGETMSCSSYHSVSGLPASSNPTSSATGLFRRAVINGGHFNININTVNKSPTTVGILRCHNANGDGNLNLR